ncbi:MAG: hypothetical protein ACR2PL_28545, partial [Dehalococcoidia bacterium]
AARRRSEPGGRAEGAPARISGVGPREAGLMVRLTYWLARRMIGRLPTPLTVAAHHRWVLFGSNAYEFAAQHFHTVEPRLIGLAELKAGALVGCPW